jgi:hypothetical protein
MTDFFGAASAAAASAVPATLPLGTKQSWPDYLTVYVFGGKAGIDVP